MAKRKLKQSDADSRAIQIIKDEKQRWENATAFITDRVSYNMRQLIRILRKNYYGTFDNPKDENTGQEKIWYPLTEINVEAVVKNIDLDQKDINFRARTPEGYEFTDITRMAVKDKLSSIYFGEKLDLFERFLAIDGTAVWKTWEEQGKMRVELVDLLNVYIDPTSPSIQEAYRFTERSLMFPEQIRRMDWRNTDIEDTKPTEGLPRVDAFMGNRTGKVTSNVKMRDVYEMWGKAPLSLVTLNSDDDDEEVDVRIVASGIDSPGGEKVHLIKLNKKTDAEGNSLKPYEEAWFTRVPNRWYGRGVAEKLLTLQIYANIVFNVRINRSRISQLGLFKIRKGAGITPQMLSRLPSNGAVVLNSLDDLQQLEVQEVGATSYKDEDVINALSERLTNAFEITTGESMPASTPATNAAIQNANAKSGFSIIKDGIGMFLERWMDRHALPIIAKELKTDYLVRIMTDDDEFSEILDRVVMYKANEALTESFKNGYLPSPEELQAEIESARKKISANGTFVKVVKDVIADQLETKVFVTNEEMDVAVTVQNLISMMNFAPEYRDAIVKQTFDLMGLSEPKAQAPQAQPGQPGPPGGAPQPGGAPGGMPPAGQVQPGTPGTPPIGASLMAAANTRALTR